ncbi:hypothetical protein ACJX0J_036371 [Zea mays]
MGLEKGLCLLLLSLSLLRMEIRFREGIHWAHYKILLDLHMHGRFISSAVIKVTISSHLNVLIALEKVNLDAGRYLCFAGFLCFGKRKKTFLNKNDSSRIAYT